MGTIAASRILNRAAKTLLDETNVQWSPTELLDYLNAGIVAICAVKTDAFIKNAVVPCVAGSLQAIPTDGFQIVQIVHNGLGNTMYQVDRKFLDHNFRTTWHSGAQVEDITNWAVDPYDPRRYWVYPAASVVASVRMVYGAAPPPLTASSDIIPIDDVHESHLYAFVLAHCYAKNSKRGDMGKMNGYLNLFNSGIGAKIEIQQLFTPNDEPPA